MRKIIAIGLILYLLCALTACEQPDAPLDALSDPILNSVGNSESNTTTSTVDNDNSAYSLHEISDDRVTIVEGKKFFSHLGVSFCVPSDWNCLEVNAEDSSPYYFREPKWGDKCEFTLSVTGSEYLNKRTEDEYLAYLSSIDGFENVNINSFTHESLCGYDCTKIVFTYSLENTEYIQTNYEYIAVGVRLYRFTTNYPAEEKNTFDSMFETIIDSIVFSTN